MVDGPFRSEVDVDLSAFRHALVDAGFQQDIWLGDSNLITTDGAFDLEYMLRRTRAARPLDTLIRMFIARQEVSAEAASNALRPMALEPLIDVGLLMRRGSGVRASVVLFPFNQSFIVHDPVAEIAREPLQPDYVLGVGTTSMTVANLTVRRHVRRALDVGTGSGCQAFAISPHADQVVATETNRRALNYATFAARLNQQENIEFREGSFLEPVEDDSFELIVSNPPFVLSPNRQFEYRDNTFEGDGLLEYLIRESAARLDDGGFATVIGNWFHHKSDDWDVRPATWANSAGCDVWVLHFDSKDHLEYAATWLRAAERDNPERYGQQFDEWIEYFDRFDGSMIAFGAIIFRRRGGGKNWRRGDTVSVPGPADPRGRQIERIFVAEDLLANASDTHGLLVHRFVLAEDHELRHTLTLNDERDWAIQSAQIRLRDGFQFAGNIDRLVATLIAGCDGKRPLQDVVESLASSLGAPTERLLPSCLAVVQKLIRSGILLPSTAPAALQD